MADYLIGECPLCEGPLRVPKGVFDLWADGDVRVGEHIPNVCPRGLPDNFYVTGDVPRCKECGYEMPSGAVVVQGGRFEGFVDDARVTPILRRQVKGQFPRYWVCL